LRWRPVLGQVPLAQRVLIEPLLAYRVAEHAVQDPPAPGEVRRGGGFAVQVEGQGVEHVTDHGRVLEDADRPGCPGYPPDGLGLVLVQLTGMAALVELLGQGVPQHGRIGGACQVAHDNGDDSGEGFDDRHAALGRDRWPCRHGEFEGVLVEGDVPAFAVH
jgi:hypothetical protein